MRRCVSCVLIFKFKGHVIYKLCLAEVVEGSFFVCASGMEGYER